MFSKRAGRLGLSQEKNVSEISWPLQEKKTKKKSSLFTGYAKIHIPIIASVSEHQPTTWFSFFFDLHILVCVFPVGLWLCIKNINDERVFIILYAVSAVYFAGVMVRLMLTLTPCVCILAAIGKISDKLSLLHRDRPYITSAKRWVEGVNKKKTKRYISPLKQISVCGWVFKVGMKKCWRLLGGWGPKVLKTSWRNIRMGPIIRDGKRCCNC